MNNGNWLWTLYWKWQVQYQNTQNSNSLKRELNWCSACHVSSRRDQFSMASCRRWFLHRRKWGAQALYAGSPWRQGEFPSQALSAITLYTSLTNHRAVSLKKKKKPRVDRRPDLCPPCTPATCLLLRPGLTPKLLWVFILQKQEENEKLVISVSWVPSFGIPFQISIILPVNLWDVTPSAPQFTFLHNHWLWDLAVRSVFCEWPFPHPWSALFCQLVWGLESQLCA